MSGATSSITSAPAMQRQLLHADADLYNLVASLHTCRQVVFAPPDIRPVPSPSRKLYHLCPMITVTIRSLYIGLGQCLGFLFLFFSRPRSERWPHHGRTFSIYPCPLSFWLTLPQRVLSKSWCCPSRLCVGVGLLLSFIGHCCPPSLSHAHISKTAHLWFYGYGYYKTPIGNFMLQVEPTVPCDTRSGRKGR